MNEVYEWTNITKDTASEYLLAQDILNSLIANPQQEWAKQKREKFQEINATMWNKSLAYYDIYKMKSEELATLIWVTN